MSSLVEQLFEFDLRGFVNIKGALSADEIATLLLFWESQNQDQALFDLSFTQMTPWQSLIDHHSYIDLIKALYHGTPRLDHAFAVTEKFISSAGRLHHHSNLLSRGIYHLTHFGQVYVGLIGLSISLRTIESGNGGFCCIPGSHKSYLPAPEKLFTTSDNGLLLQVPQEAGDVIIFSESLMHGTYPADHQFIRRSIFLRFTPGFSAFRKPSDMSVSSLPLSPNYPHNFDEGAIDMDCLTPRQAAIVCCPPFARDRMPI